MAFSISFHFFVIQSFSFPAASLILSQFLYKRTPIAIREPMIATAIVTGDVRKPIANLNVLVAAVASPTVVVYEIIDAIHRAIDLIIPAMVDAKLTTFQAAKNEPITITKPSTKLWFSDIQSPNFLSKSVIVSIADIITSPAHCPSGCKKFSQSQMPKGFSASITSFKASIAADSISRKAGTASCIVHPAMGSSTLSQNHCRPSPMFCVSGCIAFNNSSIDSNNGTKSNLAAHSAVESAIPCIVSRTVFIIPNIPAHMLSPIPAVFHASVRLAARLPIMLYTPVIIPSIFVHI